MKTKYKDTANTYNRIFTINQIDYIRTIKRYKDPILCINTYPGPDVGYDHNPLVGTFKIKQNNIECKHNTVKSRNSDSETVLKTTSTRTYDWR